MRPNFTSPTVGRQAPARPVRWVDSLDDLIPAKLDHLRDAAELLAIDWPRFRTRAPARIFLAAWLLERPLCYCSTACRKRAFRKRESTVPGRNSR
jgi:hypothetical protein